MSYSTEHIRNVALAGHPGAGKTTLFEALLHAGGAVQTPGTIERGSTVSDFDAIEKERGHSIDAAIASIDHTAPGQPLIHVNLIDTPGYPDFRGPTLSALAAVETLDASRLADLRGFGMPVLAITARRAETLKARAYDGDLARIVPPADTGLDWLRSVADPADDLRTPMKGPLQSVRDGSADLALAALALAKSAHLLPAALLVPVENALALAGTHGLTLLTLAEIAPAK